MENEIKNKTIYDLKLNETLYAEMKWGVRIDIMRVAGGWIYQPINREYNGKDHWLSPCFVPFNNEFQFGEHDEEKWKL